MPALLPDIVMAQDTTLVQAHGSSAAQPRVYLLQAVSHCCGSKSRRTTRQRGYRHMRIVIFGATGGLGRLLVDQALASGHTVTAFARTLDRLPARSMELIGVAGNVLDEEKVRAAVGGQEVVICAFGVRPGKNPGRLYSRGTRVVVEAMRAQGVRRLICVSTWLVGESRRNAGPLVRVFVPLLQPQLFRDRERQERVVRDSQLDWTLVRPARLTDRPHSGTYHVGSDLKLSARSHVSRADVADFVLHELAAPTYVRQAVTIRD